MGKRNNQKFTQIPFARLVSYLEYKCELSGIEIVIIDRGLLFNPVRITNVFC